MTRLSNRLILTSLALGSVVGTSAAVAKDCATMYQGDNFSGAGWGFEDHSESNDVRGAMIERRSWHGGFQQHWTGNDISWDDQASSVRVAPGCSFYGFADLNFTGVVQVYTAPGNGWREVNHLDRPKDITSFKCTCDAALEPGVQIWQSGAAPNGSYQHVSQ